MLRLSDIRIGTKLGITSGISIALVAGLLVNQHISQRNVAELNERAANQIAIRSSINTARTHITAIQVLRRDVNLATDLAATDRAVERLRKASGEAEGLVDSALKRVVRPENRERLLKIKPLLGSYVTAVADLAGHQKKLISEQSHQRDIVNQWVKSYEAVTTSAALANSPRRAEIEAELRAADIGMKDSRLGFWRYSTIQDKASAELAEGSVKETLAALKRVRDLATDRGFAANLDALAKEVDQIGQSILETKKAVEARAQIERERTAPARMQIEELMEGAVEAARTASAEAVALANEAAASAERISLFIGLAVVLVLLTTAVFAAFSIARPLRALVKPLEDLSSGNFAVTVPGAGRKDEVGQIAGAVQTMADKVRETIAGVKESAREVNNASAEISTATTDLSQRTEEQAASLEETSASMEEISSTVRKNAENAQQANKSAAAAQDVANRGGTVVAKAVDAMAKIEDSSRKINDIITVIDEIARQTNLLALNAAVEAARAGEAGRGFAVVASEVRTLAQRSSQAAKDIKNLITDSNSQVKDGVGLVNEAGKALDEIVNSIKTVAAVVNDIANASTEQAAGIEQINKALTQMDEVTQQNSALVEENAATAKTLEHQARAMDDRVAFFRIDASAGAVQRTPVAQARSSKSTAATGAAPASPERQTAEPASGPARTMQTQLKKAVGDGVAWAEF
jgi:methyl-accepting chemotaxis protein